ncbi:MAG: hypothetical protein EOP34_03655 [Rickettsiales bacterium]|nr:MAG: hypothetical protein EOP34_03655 [Rickettsiales bacterium]
MFIPEFAKQLPIIVADANEPKAQLAVAAYDKPVTEHVSAAVLPMLHNPVMEPVMAVIVPVFTRPFIDPFAVTVKNVP